MTSHQRKPEEMGRAGATEMVISHYVRNIGFPRYLKVEHSYEPFPKLKWCKVKKQLP